MLAHKLKTLTRLPAYSFGKSSRKRTRPAGEAKLVPEYDPETAVRLIKAMSYRAFPESVDLCIRLGINPKRSEFNIRGSCVLPHGVGRKERICFVCGNEAEEKRVKDSGIEMIADQTILDEIKNNVINFDKLYATTSGLNKLKAFAKILGPLGLFPNTKVKTLIPAEEIGKLTREHDSRRT
jgi:large subunit ribosomal protein L1